MGLEEKHTLICNKCGIPFQYNESDIFFDDHGFGYSTKLVRCKYCGKVHILKYYEDNLNINFDSRYYKY